MKTCLQILCIAAGSLMVHDHAAAQAPKKISFQAVIRNAVNGLVTSSTVGLQISILRDSATGAAVYVERHSPVTNANGLTTVSIGTGSVISGGLDSVDWGAGTYFIKADTDPGGGTSYSITAVQQLMSVPYALYAAKSGDATWVSSGNNISNRNTGNVGIGIDAPYARLHVTDSNVLFSATGDIPSSPGGTSATGAGRRMLWYADKAAFRAGYATGSEWDESSTGDYSVAMGYGTKASGYVSTATGANTTASGYYSTAMGDSTTASGSWSTVTGSRSTASGYVSTATGDHTTASGTASVATGDRTAATNYAATAMGSWCTASGPYSLATGDHATASGANAFAAGSFVKANGSYATAMGVNTLASGNAAVAMGNSDTASGTSATAMGRNAKASGSYSVSMGQNTKATGANAIAIGANNTASGTASTALGNWVSTNSKTGSFIIGDNSVSAVTNSTATNEMTMRFANGYQLYSNAAATVGVSVAPGGNSWSTISDRRKKENFAGVDGDAFLKKLGTFQLSSWNYKGQDARLYRHYGPMAQDFHAAFGKDTYGRIGNDTTINQADMEGVSFIMIQALERRTAEQEKRIKQLEAENAGLKNKYEAQNKLVAELTEKDRLTNKRLEAIEATISGKYGQVSVK